MTKEEIEMFNLALSVSDKYEKDTPSFWHTIQKLSDISLYPKCIVAMSKTYNLDCLEDELCELYVAYGDEYLTEMTNGTFETIDINPLDETGETNSIYYLYEVDPMTLQVELEHSNTPKRKQKAQLKKNVVLKKDSLCSIIPFCDILCLKSSFYNIK